MMHVASLAFFLGHCETDIDVSTSVRKNPFAPHTQAAGHGPTALLFATHTSVQADQVKISTFKNYLRLDGVSQ